MKEELTTEPIPQLSSAPQLSSFSMQELIEDLQNMDDYRDQVVPGGYRTFPEHLAEYGILHILTLLTGNRGAFPSPISRTL
jgi:hypothetical protein